MSEKYIRQVKATFSGASQSLVITDLMIEFDIKKSISGVPNSGVVTVWNLSAQSRQAIGKEYDSVTLEAGYKGGPNGASANLGIILKGKIREVFHRRNQADVLSEVKVGDGDAADRKGHVAKTYPKGTKIKDIVYDIHNDGMPGITMGELKGLDDIPDTTRPVTIFKSSRRAMDDLGRTHGFYWSYQNETLETIPADGALTQVVVISAQTGMIGVPTISDKGISVQCLIDPAIRPNRMIEVISETFEMNNEPTQYRINSVGFRGDNMDGDFDAVIEGEALAGTLTPGLKSLKGAKK